jgi:hypothetical protein
MRTWRFQLFVALVALLALVAPGCDDSDPAAKEGSTILVTANPREIPEANSLAEVVPVTVSAIVSDSQGVHQDGVEVTFTADKGCYGDTVADCISGAATGIAIRLTDDDGIATVRFYTLESTTVRAQSGSASDEETINVGGVAVVGLILLEPQDPISGGVVRGSDIDFRVTVTDTDGLPMPNQLVTIIVDPVTAATVFFPGGSRNTDSDGEVLFVLEDVQESFEVQAQVQSDLSEPAIQVEVQDP